MVGATGMALRFTPSDASSPLSNGRLHMQRNDLPATSLPDYGRSDIFGIVIIGRNEGERLTRCLQSVKTFLQTIVYVDSGSTDNSVEMATAMGVDVVKLDMHIPFTAARARNAGFQRLRSISDRLRYIQFVDGDCEIIEGWLSTATDFLDLQPTIGVVCGRLRERHPERSIYNLMCDLEWNRPSGETDACGGIFMVRADLFETLDGFRDDLVAGEEPELCRRVRNRGWKVWRLDQPMAWHDAAMLHFKQWWIRTRRTGFGYAQSAYLQRSLGERHRASQLLRPWAWAAILPMLIVGICAAFGPAGLFLLFIYPLQVLRTARAISGSNRTRWARAYFLTLGKFPELLGQLQFWARRRAANRARTFDYKS